VNKRKIGVRIMVTKEMLMENGVNGLKEIKELESVIKSLKSRFKEEEKENAYANKDKTVRMVNGLIADGTLSVGSRIIANYKDREIVATIRTIPTIKSKNLSIESDELDNKTGKFYLVKSKFIGFEDETISVNTFSILVIIVAVPKPAGTAGYICLYKARGKLLYNFALLYSP